MRCPDCNKFVGLEMQDPEVEDLSIDGSTVRATVRIVRCCSDCGTELKEATLEMETEVSGVEEHLATDGEHELAVEEDNVGQLEEGGGRYTKSYFGAEVSFTVKCFCGEFEVSGSMSDKVAASYMDEMV